MAVCPTCGSQIGETAIFCDQCGTRLRQPVEAAAQPTPIPASASAICPACGAGNVPGEAFCDFCGLPLGEPAPSAAAIPPAEPAQAVPVAATPAIASAEGICPACGASVLPGEVFCPICGASLAQPPIPPESVPAGEAEEAPSVVPPMPTTVEAPPESAGESVTAIEEALPAPALVPVPTCPACGVEVAPGDKFCSNCGARLAPAAVATPAQAEPGITAMPSGLGPCLIVVATGVEIPLPAKNEVLIGREDPVSSVFPDIDLTPHGGDEGGVSRRHARIVAEGMTYYILDLDSTNFTFVNQQKLAPNTRQLLKEGDEIRCGRVQLLWRSGV